MELGLVREIGSKALLAGGLTLLGYWIYNAVKLVLDARGINPLIKQFFTQVAAGRIDAAYLLTTKACLLYTSPSPRDAHESRMPSSA